MSPETRVAEYLEKHESKELLQFLTCGSVDDGKSTLIGRLLIDTGSLYEDQLATLRKDSHAHGTAGADLDPALVTDGLKAEREQGITIDVAYRYFATPKRKFIIADTPGHEQYTRNMASGASNSELAVILVDARQGVLTQTRRHSFIVSLLGIRHVVIAINKMDLVGWSQQRFEELQAQYRALAAQLDLPELTFIPLAALKGDNVVQRSTHMGWYGGPTLLEHLEQVQVEPAGAAGSLRLPVQLVLRVGSSFRGFAGTLASGTLAAGDEVQVLPSRRTAKVSTIIASGIGQSTVQTGEAVTVTLDREIDISRGDLLVAPDAPPFMVQHFAANVVWMAEEPLVPGREYLVEHAGASVPCRVTRVEHAVDVNTLVRRPATRLALNEIGRCTFSAAQPLMLDAYSANRTTGAFVLVDRLTNVTAGAGMVIDRRAERAGAQAARPEALPPPRREGGLTPQDYEERLGQSGWVFWLTGPSTAATASLARGFAQRLFNTGHLPYVLDAGELRGLCEGLKSSEQDRAEAVRRAAHAADLMRRAGFICIVTVDTPLLAQRALARACVPAGRFFEVHVSATGPAADYEAPTGAELVLPMVETTLEDAIELLSAQLRPA
jgi:bifunctional enzyme CysN/CysC